MKFSKTLALFALSLFAGSISMGAFALPILAQNSFIKIEQSPSPLGTLSVPITEPYVVGDMIPVTNSIANNGGYINLSDADTDTRTKMINPSPSDCGGCTDWWTGPGYIFSTNSNTLNITFTNLMVTAFTFRIGANTAASGWIKAYYETDGGPEASLLTAPNFPISPSDSKTYGVYAKNTASSCTVITKIVVEPPFTWGIGDFGITLGGGPCEVVPEPESMSLLVLGLLGIGLVSFGQRRRKLHIQHG